MPRYLLRRLFALGTLLVIIFFTVKVVLRLLPGDPVDVILAETGANIDPEVLRHSLGLDRPFLSSTIQQLTLILKKFDWGNSISFQRPIGPILWERATASLELGITAMCTALAFSFALVLSTQLSSRAILVKKTIVRIISILSISLPTAWFGPILGFLLAVKLHAFDLTGGLALPTITLAFSLCGFWIRAISETLDREMRSDATRTARAKGLHEWKVIGKHAFLPAAGPLIAYLGSQTGSLFAGAVITETLFSRPGLGSLLVESIFKRDYPLIEATLVLSSTFILFGNFIGDFLQTLLQPKLRDAE